MSPRSAFALLAAACLSAGCLSSTEVQIEQYVLAVTRGEADTPPVDAGPVVARGGALRVHRLRVSPLFQGTGFVYRSDDATLTSDFYRRFFSPPGGQLLLAVDRWLGESPLFETTLRPSDAAQADYVLEGMARELYVDLRGPQPEAVLAIDFQLIDAGSRRLDVVLDGSYASRVPLEGSSGEAIAAAWSRALTEILIELERDLWQAIPPQPAAEPG